MNNKIYRRNLLSIDLESWIFSLRMNKLNLSVKELKRLDNNYTPQVIEYLLKVLKKNNQKITFFTVAKLEELYPDIFEKIKLDGHEIGWHSHSHAVIDNQEILKKELDKSKKMIEKYKVVGFQSPAIIFFREGYKILKEHGFKYSSSTYGNSNLIRKIDGIFEIPVSTNYSNYKPGTNDVVFPANMTFSNLRRFGIPYGSSYFWGLLGENYYKKKITQAMKQKKIVNMFIHDWQIIKPRAEEYKKDVNFFWNPLFYPYKKNLDSMFNFLTMNFKFVRFRDFLKNEGEKRRN